MESPQVADESAQKAGPGAGTDVANDVRVVGAAGHPGKDVIDEAAQNGDVPDARTPHGAAQLESAAEFLLASFHGDEGEVTRTLEINVGGVHPNERWIPWIIKSIPGPRIRLIRQQASEAVARDPRKMMTGDAEAGFTANLKVVLEGTVDPDIVGLAHSVQLASPADFLETALNKKQGLIDQIAAQILGLSGYEDTDLRDSAEVKAVPSS